MRTLTFVDMDNMTATSDPGLVNSSTAAVNRLNLRSSTAATQQDNIIMYKNDMSGQTNLCEVVFDPIFNLVFSKKSRLVRYYTRHDIIVCRVM